jgi:hypothetical protein
MLYSRQRFAALLVLTFLSAAGLFGQAVAIGSVSGTVSDQSGSSVPGATVRMIETDKGTVYTGTSTADGRYTFNNLPTGPYRLGYRRRLQELCAERNRVQVAENLSRTSPCKLAH